MKGKWSQGIRPRHLYWVLQDQLAVCERPGGYGHSHRRVRRSEEIIWIRQQGFTRVVSLIPSSYNLHNYTEMGLPWIHWPIADGDDIRSRLIPLYTELQGLLQNNERLLLHRSELGDVVRGVISGYLIWTGQISDVWEAVARVEQLTERPIGRRGRQIVTAAADLPPSTADTEAE